jgi:hypothetical protein
MKWDSLVENLFRCSPVRDEDNEVFRLGRHDYQGGRVAWPSNAGLRRLGQTSTP